MQYYPGGSRQQCTGKNVVLILLGQHCTGKTLSNVVLEAQDNDTKEKILFNVVLILLGQHCTGNYPMWYCPWGSR